MKLSIFTQHIWDMARSRGWTKDQAMDHVTGLGISGVEITYTEFQQTPKEDYKAMLERHGLNTVCIHRLVPLASNDEEIFQKALADCRSLIDDASYMGAPNVLIVASDGSDIAGKADKERAKERIIHGLRELVSYGMPLGIHVTLENFSVPHYPFSYIDDLESIYQAVPGLGYTLDAGNFTCVGEDVLEAYQRLKPYMVHFHVKEWAYTDNPAGIHCTDGKLVNGVAYGTGVVPLRELIRQSRADGLYTGAIVLEHNAVFVFSADDIARSAAFLRDQLRDQLR